MNKKRAVKLGIITGIIVLLGTIGVLEVKKMTEPTEKEKQVAFLREHESEITDYIKSQSPKIESVQFNWNSVKTEKIGNGTPMGAGKLLILEGGFNDIKDSNFVLSFGMDDDNISKLDTIGLLNSLYVGGIIYE